MYKELQPVTPQATLPPIVPYIPHFLGVAFVCLSYYRSLYPADPLASQIFDSYVPIQLLLFALVYTCTYLSPTAVPNPLLLHPHGVTLPSGFLARPQIKSVIVTEQWKYWWMVEDIYLTTTADNRIYVAAYNDNERILKEINDWLNETHTKDCPALPAEPSN